jgi:hypothetical protein
MSANEKFFLFFLENTIFMLKSFPCHADTVIGGVKTRARWTEFGPTLKRRNGKGGNQ